MERKEDKTLTGSLNKKDSDHDELKPSYENLEESFGTNIYSVDCCRCNPQRC